MTLLPLPELLQLLHHPHEHTSINHQTTNQPFTSRILPSHQAHQHATTLPTNADIWYGINPVNPNTTGRGTNENITRLAALWTDLDIKEGGLPTWETAHTVINTLADMLGTRPTAIVNSGHGLQPLWATDHDDTNLTLDTNEKRIAAQALLRRWGRLVTTVADSYNGQVDSVFDLPRVLRAPGTNNNKNTDQPLPVIAITDTGHPLDYTTIEETLTAYGVTQQPEDTEQLGDTISPPNTWEFAPYTCIYAQKMITGWQQDTPTERHPWLTSQATRLAALVRGGCLTRDDYINAGHQLRTRFQQLLTNTPAREEAYGEYAGALQWGRNRVATMNPTRLQREVGDHPHQFEDLPTRPTPTPQRHLTAVTTTDGSTALQPQPHTDPDNTPTPTAQVVAFERRAAPNEDNTSLILVDQHKTEVRYNPQRGQWLTWTNHKWTWDEVGHVHELVRHISRNLPEGEGWSTYKKRALSLGGVRAVAGLAATDPRTVATLNKLDAHPYELNTPEGIVNLNDGTLHPPNPTQLHTRSTTVAPNPDCPTPRWNQFLTDTFAGHEDVLPFVQELAGYSATGAVTHHILPFLHGPGSNGKSVFLDVLRNILGDYAGAAPAKFLMAGVNQHETEIARLSGLRMVITSEVNQDDKFDEAKVKILTGGDALTARFMRQDYFDFTPTHHLWLMGNHQPKVSGGGESFWRRLRLIPFTNIVPPEKKIDDLAQLLTTEEGPGILSWIIQGAVNVIRHGMNAPQSVLAATETYASEEDALARFISDRCHISANDAARTNTADLRGAYTQWCDREGEKVMSPQVFGRELRTRYGVEQKKSNGRRMYIGLTLLADEDEPDAVEDWWQK